MPVKNPVSLGDLALELSINKSKLAYYVKLGLLEPAAKVGRTNIFERDEALKRLKSIKEIQERQHATLDEIVQNSKSNR